MSLIVDEVIGAVQSQSSNNVYELRFRADSDEHRWVSCNCPSWTRGREQAGRETWERECKHTRSAMAQSEELKRLVWGGTDEAVVFGKRIRMFARVGLSPRMAGRVVSADKAEIYDWEAAKKISDEFLTAASRDAQKAEGAKKKPKSRFDSLEL